MSTAKLLIRRARHHWQQFLTLALGVILATTFMAVAPLLVDAIIELGLRRTFADAGITTGGLYFTTRQQPEPERHQHLGEQFQHASQQVFGARFSHLVPSGRVGLMYPWVAGRVEPDTRLKLAFHGADSDLAFRSERLAAGLWPDESRIEQNSIDVVLGPSVAGEFDLEVGDRLPIVISARADAPELWLEVTGISSADGPPDPYWFNTLSPTEQAQQRTDIENYDVYVTEEAFFRLAPELFPSLRVTYAWEVVVDLPSYKENHIWQGVAARLEQDLVPVAEDLRVNTAMSTLLDDYVVDTATVGAPLYFLLTILVLIVLYYLVMVSSLSLERSDGEFAVMRSRGASAGQIFRLQLLEAVSIGTVAVISGPVLARLIVSEFTMRGPMAGPEAAGWTLSVTQAAWLAAAVAAVASMASLLLPLPSSLKRTIVMHQRATSRRSKPPWWQRFYLDVFVLLVGLVLLWRLQLHGSIVGGSAETPRVDFLLLLAPLSLLLGAAATLLRVFPVILQAGSRIAGRGRGLSAPLAFWQAARNPRHFTRLVLLLMLAMTLALFSTSLDAALDQNERDRSRYLVGADARVASATIESDKGPWPELGGSTAAAWRTDASLDFGTTFPDLDLLAINSGTFNALATYRSDYAERPLANLTNEMAQGWTQLAESPSGAPLPGTPERMGVWLTLPFSKREEITSTMILNEISIELKLITSSDEEQLVRLLFNEPPQETEDAWRYFEAELPALRPEEYPLYLKGLWIRSAKLNPDWRDTLLFDDITVFDDTPGAGATVVESFEGGNTGRWYSVTTPLRATSIPADPKSGYFSLAVNFGTAGMSPVKWYGINRIDSEPRRPIPVLASRGFMSRTELKPGEEFRASLRVLGTVDWSKLYFTVWDEITYFPTLYEGEEAGYVVTLLDPVLHRVNRERHEPIQANELFIQIDDGESLNTLLSMLDLPDQGQVLSAESVHQAFKAEPLAAGLRGATLFGAVLTTVLSIVGFTSHFYMTTQQRSANYGILRAIGYSSGQVYLTLMLEQLVLILSGLALGTILGLLLNELTLSGLPLALGGGEVVPPFIPKANWAPVFQVYLALGCAFIFSLGVATYFLWRLQIHRVLRVGEE